jgi:hypothetical protein
MGLLSFKLFSVDGGELFNSGRLLVSQRLSRYYLFFTANLDSRRLRGQFRFSLRVCCHNVVIILNDTCCDEHAFLEQLSVSRLHSLFIILIILHWGRDST